MTVKFNKLFKLLIDKDMQKGELVRQAGISSSSMAKLKKGANVNVEVLVRICRVLDCTFDDIMEIPPLEEGGTTLGEAKKKLTVLLKAMFCVITKTLFCLTNAEKNQIKKESY